MISLHVSRTPCDCIVLMVIKPRHILNAVRVCIRSTVLMCIFLRYSITFLHYIYALLERDQNAPSSQLPESADWIPDGFWDNKSSTQYDAVDIKSSEKQLTRELIATLLLQHCSLYSGCRFILYILAMYKYNYAPVYDIAFRYVGRLPTFG